MPKQTDEELAVVSAKQKLVAARAKRDAALDEVRVMSEAAIAKTVSEAATRNKELQKAYDVAEIAMLADIAAAEKAQADATARQLSSDSAVALPDLGVVRAEAIQLVRDLQSLPQPEDPGESAAFDARVRLAQEAQKRAEDDYAAALNAIHSDHLTELTKG